VSLAQLPARVTRGDLQELAAVFRRVADVSDVLQEDVDAVAREDDEVADVVDVDELALAADQVCRVALVDLSERQVLVFLLRDLLDTVD